MRPLFVRARTAAVECCRRWQGIRTSSYMSMIQGDIRARHRLECTNQYVTSASERREGASLRLRGDGMKFFTSYVMRVGRGGGTCLLHGGAGADRGAPGSRRPDCPRQRQGRRKAAGFRCAWIFRSCPMPRPRPARCAGVSPSLSSRGVASTTPTGSRPSASRYCGPQHQSLLRRGSDQRRLPVSQSVDSAERDGRVAPAGNPVDLWWRVVHRLRRMANYSGEQLAEKGVVYVSVGYRVGAFGFMSHPQLTAESPFHASGNYGYLDQVAALQWIQRNIQRFGGDPAACDRHGPVRRRRFGIQSAGEPAGQGICFIASSA